MILMENPALPEAKLALDLWGFVIKADGLVAIIATVIIIFLIFNLRRRI